MRGKRLGLVVGNAWCRDAPCVVDDGSIDRCNPGSTGRAEEEWSSCERTNHGNKGLISVDRRTKPTLILTIPGFLFKSSTKDLSSRIFEIVIQDTHEATHLTWHPRPSQSYDLGLAAIIIRLKFTKVDIVTSQHGF